MVEGEFKAAEKVSDAALEKVGIERYSYFDAVYVGIRELMWKHLKIRLPYKNKGGEICSEFVARLLEIEPVGLSPGALYEKLRILFPTE